jgi:hypothetical protein
VRAYHTLPTGARGRLDEATVAAALDASGQRDRVRVIVGDGQTDFVPTGVDKGRGLCVLAAHLGGGHGGSPASGPAAGPAGEPAGVPARVALAVGDSASDLPMFAVAQLARAPRNADSIVRGSGVRVLNRYYQAGLAMAVAEIIGHRPTTCDRCATGELSPGTTLLLTVLSAQQNGIVGLPRQVARLATWVGTGALR